MKSREITSPKDPSHIKPKSKLQQAIEWDFKDSSTFALQVATNSNGNLPIKPDELALHIALVKLLTTAPKVAVGALLIYLGTNMAPIPAIIMKCDTEETEILDLEGKEGKKITPGKNSGGILKLTFPGSENGAQYTKKIADPNVEDGKKITSSHKLVFLGIGSKIEEAVKAVARKALHLEPSEGESKAKTRIRKRLFLNPSKTKLHYIAPEIDQHINRTAYDPTNQPASDTQPVKVTTTVSGAHLITTGGFFASRAIVDGIEGAGTIIKAISNPGSFIKKTMENKPLPNLFENEQLNSQPTNIENIAPSSNHMKLK